MSTMQHTRNEAQVLCTEADELRRSGVYCRGEVVRKCVYRGAQSPTIETVQHHPIPKSQSAFNSRNEIVTAIKYLIP